MAAALSQEEAACLEALEVFVQGRYHRSMLIRFVLARKADIPRCKTLITKFDEIEETLHPAAIRARHVRSILERGVLQLPGTRDKLGGKLIVYHANRHIKTRSDVERVAAIKAAIYVVEAALAAVEDLRHGVSIVANLGGLGYGKLDHVMHKIVLDTLQDAYPARVVRVYVVYPGFVTDMLLKMMRPFMKAKLKEKIVLVPTFDKLQQHIVQDQLPQVFGGSLAFDHHRWLNERLAEEAEPIPEYSAREELEERRKLRQAQLLLRTRARAVGEENGHEPEEQSGPSPANATAEDPVAVNDIEISVNS